MKTSLVKTSSAAGILVSALLVGAPVASAATDLASLPVDPNVITDSTAYTPQPPVFDPDGVHGVQQTFTHRDGSRQITDTLLMPGDPPAAIAALEASRSTSASIVVDQKTTPVPVGENGVLITGTSPDRAHSVSVLLFTRGATAAEIQFEGGAQDPVPTDLVIDYGQRQDDAIQRPSETE